MASVSTRGKVALPNLLLSTTYALNKSYSKRVTIGLEYTDNSYKPVVKLCCSGSTGKYVTLDTRKWDLLTNEMDKITAFLQDSYVFYETYGNPSSTYLPNLEIIYKTAYGSRAICLEERTTNQANDNTSADKSRPSTYGDNGSSTYRKRKNDSTPSITMQETTFDGLRVMRECINARLNYLDQISGTVNSIADSVANFIQQKLSTDGSEIARNILRDDETFKRFFMMNYVEIHTAAQKSVQEPAKLSEKYIDTLLLEMCAFGTHWMCKHVNEMNNPQNLM